MSLALRYRPQSLDDLVGQPAVQVILRQMILKDAVPSAMLFSGSRGTGKTTTARIVAAAVNCQGTGVRPCGGCASCVATFDGSSMDVNEIDAASNGGVEDMRALRQQVRFQTGGRYRVVILDEAQSCSKAAFNALLTTLEEPPEATKFILCTTEPDAILDTVDSRCAPFDFHRLTVADIAARLRHIAAAEHINADDDLLLTMADRADGAMRNAVVLLEQIASVGISTAEQYQRLIGRVDQAPTILGALASGDLATAFTRLDDALTRVADARSLIADIGSVLRDLLVLRCGGELHTTGVSLAARQNLALALETTTIVNACTILWDLKTKARQDDARSSLELAVVMLHEVFAADRPASTPNRLSLAQMQGLR